ncbi:MAG TPA: DUF1778 domain-containing protein [Nostocaceae cyanobacterium]|nr:DUF1778 domain-containing protein [Nostocaceae cyanobacterium]
MAVESRLTIRLNQDIRDALRRKSEAEGKTVTEVIVSFIMEYLKQPTENTEGEKASLTVEQRLERLESLIDRHLGELAA